jgi:hypothetical protein
VIADLTPTYTKPILKRQQYQVRIYYRLSKYLPFEVVNKRIIGWKHQRPLPDGGRVVMTANETITPGDIFVLIAAIKVFQDNKDAVMQSNIQQKDKSIELLSITVSYESFKKKYIMHNNYYKLIDTLVRLASFQVSWYRSNGKFDLHRYLWNFAIDAGKQNITFTISKSFAELCVTRGWLLNFNYLQNISSPTARALFLYFSTNSGQRYKLETLQKWLDMPSGDSRRARDNRKQIKRALSELVSAGFLVGYGLQSGTVNLVHSSHKTGTPPPQGA